MILRGPKIAEERLVLPVGSAFRAPSAAAPKSSVFGPSIQTEVAVETRIEPPAPPPPPKEKELTFEAVVAWLAVQDAETRAGCAAILATEVTKIHETAKAEGYEAGKRLGEQAARTEAQSVLERLRAISEAAEQAYIREEQALQDACVEIVAEAFGKIAGTHLTSHAGIGEVVKQVLTRVRNDRELTIHVARDDLATLQAMRPEIADVLGARKFELVADNRVELGGCLVETKLGSLDGRLEVQLRELYETLRLAKLAGREIP